MSCDHYSIRLRLNIVTRALVNALALELLAYNWVMDELSENGEGSFAGELLGLGDGVADAETETEMLGENNFHELDFRFTL